MNQEYRDSLEQALHRLIDAWEALPGGRNYRPREIEEWLRTHMTPAINHARKTLGRHPPKRKET